MGRFVVEYTGIDWHKYYGGCMETHGRITREFDTREEALAFAFAAGQDDGGVGCGKNRHFHENKKNVRIYEKIW